MNRVAVWAVVLAWGLALPTLQTPGAFAAAEIYAPLKPDDIRIHVIASLSDQQLTDDVRQKIDSIWTGVDLSVSPDRLLELVLQSFAVADPDVMKLVRECNSPPSSMTTLRMEIVNRTNRNEFFRSNVSLFYGRYLIERRLFDESWDLLKSIDARQVVDPASLFFFQAVAAQGMLEIKSALDAIDQLLTNTERVPVRYTAAATLMQADLKSFEEKSLGEIARLMSDSERRLELGRAGEKVQSVQERIISDLDELIKKTEQQKSGGGGGGGGQGGSSNNSSGGAEDSSVKGAEAAGETDKKQFDNKGNWGNLPEKDLTKAKNDLNKNFPSHYEQAIEKYTKKLATRAAKKK